MNKSVIVFYVSDHHHLVKEQLKSNKSKNVKVDNLSATLLVIGFWNYKDIYVKTVKMNKGTFLCNVWDPKPWNKCVKISSSSDSPVLTLLHCGLKSNIYFVHRKSLILMFFDQTILEFANCPRQFKC